MGELQLVPALNAPATVWQRPAALPPGFNGAPTRQPRRWDFVRRLYQEGNSRQSFARGDDASRRKLLTCSPANKKSHRWPTVAREAPVGVEPTMADLQSGSHCPELPKKTPVFARRGSQAAAVSAEILAVSARSAIVPGRATLLDPDLARLIDCLARPCPRPPGWRSWRWSRHHRCRRRVPHVRKAPATGGVGDAGRSDVRRRDARSGGPLAASHF